MKVWECPFCGPNSQRATGPVMAPYCHCPCSACSARPMIPIPAWNAWLTDCGDYWLRVVPVALS
jgi:hypothetical protein